jgi:hypothetical protein
VPIPLQQQPETHSPFRAILHPPKSLPPITTHQYNTRTRRILSVLRGFTHNPPPTNTKTRSSTLNHLDPDPPTLTRPRPRLPHSDPDHESNPDPDTPEPENNTLVLNLDSSGRPLTYSSAKRGPDKDNWTLAELEEITRLILSSTLFPILHSAIPHDRRRDVVYYNPVVKQKLNPDGTIKFRVRGTAGGNLLSVPYDVSARTASLDVVKLLLHSTVSDNKKWFTIDIKDFYLGTPLPASRYEYVRIELSKLPPAAITTHHNLTPFIHNNSVYIEIRKCMYGLPQAGRLSQLRLISHLKEHGYHQCPNTPCLFKHESRDIMLCLVVDNFGVRYGTQDDADHLINALRSHDYELTVKPKGDTYLGMHISFTPTSVSISMPCYIDKMLKRFCPHLPTHRPSQTPGATSTKCSNIFVPTCPRIAPLRHSDATLSRSTLKFNTPTWMTHPLSLPINAPNFKPLLAPYSITHVPWILLFNPLPTNSRPSKLLPQYVSSKLPIASYPRRQLE